MIIYIDADACPVTKIAEKIAKKYSVPCVLICDTNHILNSDYSKTIVVSAGADSVDLEIINRLKPNDIVITQDYGVAALSLGKGGHAIHQSGKVFTNDNIEGLLFQRHASKKARMKSSKNHFKGPKKRTLEDDANFEKEFEKLVISLN